MGPDGEIAARSARLWQRHEIKSVLATHYPATRANVDIVSGMWRAMNLQLPPFSLPAPLDLIVEGCTENKGAVADKTLALFDLAAWGPDKIVEEL